MGGEAPFEIGDAPVGGVELVLQDHDPPGRVEAEPLVEQLPHPGGQHE